MFIINFTVVIAVIHSPKIGLQLQNPKKDTSTSEKKRASLFCKFISPSRSASKQLALREVSASTPPRSARSPFLALREVQARSVQGAGSLCARCRFTPRKAQGRSGQGAGSLCARCRVALGEVKGCAARGSGSLWARCRVAFGEVQGRSVQVDTCEKCKCHRSQFCEKHF